jgi:hypothetical protein
VIRSRCGEAIGDHQLPGRALCRLWGGRGRASGMSERPSVLIQWTAKKFATCTYFVLDGITALDV